VFVFYFYFTFISFCFSSPSLKFIFLLSLPTMPRKAKDKSSEAAKKRKFSDLEYAIDVLTAQITTPPSASYAEEAVLDVPRHTALLQALTITSARLQQFTNGFAELVARQRGGIDTIPYGDWSALPLVVFDLIMSRMNHGLYLRRVCKGWARCYTKLYVRKMRITPSRSLTALSQFSNKKCMSAAATKKLMDGVTDCFKFTGRTVVELDVSCLSWSGPNENIFVSFMEALSEKRGFRQCGGMVLYDVYLPVRSGALSCMHLPSVLTCSGGSALFVVYPRALGVEELRFDITPDVGDAGRDIKHIEFPSLKRVVLQMKKVFQRFESCGAVRTAVAFIRAKRPHTVVASDEIIDCSRQPGTVLFFDWLDGVQFLQRLSGEIVAQAGPDGHLVGVSTLLPDAV
jgi:hypothetical protein